MYPGHLDHGINNGAGLNAIDAAAEKPVLPANRKGTNRILAEIIRKAATPVL